MELEHERRKERDRLQKVVELEHERRKERDRVTGLTQ